MTFVKTRAFQEPTLRDIALDALLRFESGEDNFYDTALKVYVAYQDDKRVNADLDIRLIKKARENAFHDLFSTSHNTPAQIEMLQEFKDVIEKINVTNQRNRVPLPLVLAPRFSETVHVMESAEYVGCSIRIELPDPELEAGEDIVADFRKALEKIEDAVKIINNTGLGLI